MSLDRRRSCPGRSPEDSCRPSVRQHLFLVLVLVLVLTALLILSRLGLALASVFATGPMDPGPTSVWPPAAGRETSVPGPLYAIAPGFLIHVLDQISGRRFLVDT
jgi:hypothetical protein